MIILLVEDEPLIAMVVEAALLDAGHTICGPAATVAESLEILENELPDLALVDINLRDGSSGIELARELMARWGVPSLFMSGQRLEAYANRDVALGYIGKPYSPETVVASIKVAERIIAHQPAPEVPPELELFEKPE